MGLDVYITSSNSKDKIDVENEDLYFRKSWGLIEELQEINKDINDMEYIEHIVVDVEKTRKILLNRIANKFESPYHRPNEYHSYYADNGDLYDDDWKIFVAYLIRCEDKFIHIENSY